MGFRDLTCFNKALLAKQCWRLIKNPHSLPAEIIKSKYFLKGSFQEATIGSRPSLARRSIASTKDLLYDGLIWCGRDG
jgi:hypothetical protein